MERFRSIVWREQRPELAQDCFWKPKQNNQTPSPAACFTAASLLTCAFPLSQNPNSRRLTAQLGEKLGSGIGRIWHSSSTLTPVFALKIGPLMLHHHDHLIKVYFCQLRFTVSNKKMPQQQIGKQLYSMNITIKLTVRKACLCKKKNIRNVSSNTGPQCAFLGRRNFSKCWSPVRNERSCSEFSWT